MPDKHSQGRDNSKMVATLIPALGACVSRMTADKRRLRQRVKRAPKHTPSGQYQAVRIDEGHDFVPEWLRPVTQMVDPTTNNLLVLYDDAQRIYERSRSKQFSFKEVGVQAQGRTTILKINYRNTQQILQTASLIAADLLAAAKAGDSAKFEDANKRWYDNADQIAVFLNSANPDHWSLAEMQTMMSSHLDLTLEEASARLNADWSGDVVAYDKVHDEILQMAHMLTEGIIAQFPKTFK